MDNLGGSPTITHRKGTDVLKHREVRSWGKVPSARVKKKKDNLVKVTCDVNTLKDYLTKDLKTQVSDLSKKVAVLTEERDRYSAINNYLRSNADAVFKRQVLDGVLERIGVNKKKAANKDLKEYFGDRSNKELRAIGLRRSDEAYLRLGDESTPRYAAITFIHRTADAAKQDILLWATSQDRRWRRWVNEVLFDD